LSSIQGPVPTTDSAFLRSPNFSTHSLAMIHVDVDARLSRNQALGSLRMNLTVCLSGVSMRSIDSSTGRLPLFFVLRNRSYVYFTSSDVSSRPLKGGFGCHRTPLRSLKTKVFSSGRVHDSARSGSIGYVIGFTSGPALTFTRRL
jgi:hypothetical protein